MRETGFRLLEGEILGDDIPDPEAREVTPGWITRNRDSIMQGRAMAQMLALAAPPPARLALAALAVATEGLVLTADARRGVLSARDAAQKAGALALEGAAIFAATRFAPKLLARHGHHIGTLQSVLHRLRPAPGS